MDREELDALLNALQNPRLKQALIAVMAPFVHVPLTLETGLRARIAFFDFALDYNLLGPASKIVAALTGQEMSEQAALHFINNKMAIYLKELGKVLEDLPTFLAQRRKSEEDIVIAKFALTGDLRKRYIAGKLTIGQLLTYQPVSIYKIDLAFHLTN